MNTLDRYRSVEEYREILRILQNSTESKENFLWQTTATGRVIIPILALEIDFISREVFVQLSPSMKDQIDPESTLYVKLNFKDSVFKISEYRQDKARIYFSFPAMIKTIEFRRKPRHIFKPEDNKYLIVRAGQDVNKDYGSEVKTTVGDISETGAGLIVSENNRSFFKNNKILWLTGMQDTKLPQALLCEVVYINNDYDPNFINRKMKQVKVGIRFLVPVTPEFLQHTIL